MFCLDMFGQLYDLWLWHGEMASIVYSTFIMFVGFVIERLGLKDDRKSRELILIHAIEMIAHLIHQ